MKKQFKLPKEFAEKWLTALRSGKYEQGKGYLQEFKDELRTLTDDKNPKTCNYCCLGVAAYISGVSPNILNTEFIDDWNDIIPDEIKGSIDAFPSILSNLNDGIDKTDYLGFLEEHELEELKFRSFDIMQEFTIEEQVKLDFDQIADFIEDNCEFYEEETIKN